ncbi:MAG TPA: RDD family protein [Pyrinomonadaceae bacterium]|nr:RDD family protein [Pyrinomonadaceae bacterium]
MREADSSDDAYMESTGNTPTQPRERKSTLIEFPGVSRNSLPEWRKELSERVREVQERRAREAAHEAAREAADAERRWVESAVNPPQLELLPPAEMPAINPLVAAALKRIERAHQTAPTETRQPRTTLATAIAYAPAREDNDMNETVGPSTTQLTFEPEIPIEEVHIEEPPPAVEKTHLVVVPPVEPAPAPRAPKRLIRDDPNDPALNYLDSISRNLRVDDSRAKSASAFRRLVSAVLDLIFCGLITSAIAGAVYLTGNDVRDPRALVVLGGSFVVVSFIYFTLMTALTGRTWAMRLLSMKVIDTKTGLIPTGGQSIGRSFFYLLSLATVLGILTALFSREGYAAHDRFTRTAVVMTT